MRKSLFSLVVDAYAVPLMRVCVMLLLVCSSLRVLFTNYGDEICGRSDVTIMRIMYFVQRTEIQNGNYP
jgi:hypothetical protein